MLFHGNLVVRKVVSVCIILIALLPRLAYIRSRESGRCLFCHHKRGFCNFPCLSRIWLTAVQPWQILPALRCDSLSFFFSPSHLLDSLLSCCSLWFLSLLNALLWANGFKTFFKCLPVSLQSCCGRPWGLFGENSTSCSSSFCYYGELCKMNEGHNCLPCTSKSSITHYQLMVLEQACSCQIQFQCLSGFSALMLWVYRVLSLRIRSTDGYR